MATYRTILNRVLALAGEDKVAGSVNELTEAYHILVGAILNQIKEEVEGATQWRALWHTQDVTYGASETQVVIANTTGNSQVVRIQDAKYPMLVPLVYDITDANAPVRLRELDLPELIDKQQALGLSTADNPPMGFSVNTDGTYSYLKLYPVPQTTKVVRITLVTPQAYLDEDDLDVNILVPEAPLFAGVMWYVLQERGENLGAASLFTEERYRNVLDIAVARDEAARGDNDLVVV